MAPKELTLGIADWDRAESNDRLSFEDLLARHQRMVLRTALRLVGNLEDAKDAAQEVFYRLHKHRATLRGGEDAAPWLYRVTVNVCRDLRRKRRELPLADAVDPADETPGAEAAADMESRRRLLRIALRRLPDREREVVVLHDIEGLSSREVAEAIGTAEVTVRSHLSCGRAKLREICAALMRNQS